MFSFLENSRIDYVKEYDLGHLKDQWIKEAYVEELMYNEGNNDLIDDEMNFAEEYERDMFDIDLVLFAIKNEHAVKGLEITVQSKVLPCVCVFHLKNTALHAFGVKIDQSDLTRKKQFPLPLHDIKIGATVAGNGIFVLNYTAALIRREEGSIPTSGAENRDSIIFIQPDDEIRILVSDEVKSRGFEDFFTVSENWGNPSLFQSLIEPRVYTANNGIHFLKEYERYVADDLAAWPLDALKYFSGIYLINYATLPNSVFLKGRNLPISGKVDRRRWVSDRLYVKHQLSELLEPHEQNRIKHMAVRWAELSVSYDTDIFNGFRCWGRGYDPIGTTRVHCKFGNDIFACYTTINEKTRFRIMLDHKQYVMYNAEIIKPMQMTWEDLFKEHEEYRSKLERYLQERRWNNTDLITGIHILPCSTPLYSQDPGQEKPMELVIGMTFAEKLQGTQ